MMKVFSLYRQFVQLIMLALLISGCTTKPLAPVNEIVTIRFAALRILDALPLFVAQEQGYFADHGINVEIIPVGSAPEREQLIAAGQADAMINELTSTLFANRDRINFQVVRFARAADREHAVFKILAASNSGITDVSDLKHAQIAISEGTVIEYLTDRLLEAEGFTSTEINKVSIPNISDRLAVLNSGELAAAVLPDPLANLAIQNGAVVVMDDSAHPEYGYSVVTFRKSFIDQNPDAVSAFLSAWERAVSDINLQPDQFKDLLAERELVPPPLLVGYSVPPFVIAGVPSQFQFDDAVAWGKSKGTLVQDMIYSNHINAQFLP
jgi:NitT/TauT family transport system substrate-binding protein